MQILPFVLLFLCVLRALKKINHKDSIWKYSEKSSEIIELKAYPFLDGRGVERVMENYDFDYLPILKKPRCGSLKEYRPWTLPSSCADGDLISKRSVPS